MTKRSERQVVDRLGEAGLRRAIDDVLDAGRLVRLANACGLRYPGMRTQSQKRERVLADLTAKAAREDAARKTVVRTLRKETAKEAREWKGLSAEQRVALVRQDETDEDGALGLRLFLLADGPEDPATEPVLAGLVEGAPPDAGAPASGPDAEELRKLRREVTRLRKRSTEQQKKLQHLEGQLTKLRETEKTLKRDVIERKGELAESRMLAERLRKELDEVRGSSQAGSRSNLGVSAAVEERVETMRRALRKLSTEQRKLVHALTQDGEAKRPAPVVPTEALAPIVEAIADLRKEVVALRRERKRDGQEQRKHLDLLRAEIAERGIPVAGAPQRGRRAKGAAERVGVFVDVQNMWYSARQLKGKLDFDALLQAAVLGRRLIRATAYVVETKEIDQSGFIAILEQRGIEVRRKTLKVRADGSTKGDWDMEMAFDVLDSAPALDVVCLVSGDGDFTSLAHRVKAIGPRVEVLGFPRNTAKSLIEAADRFQPLDRKFMIRSKEASGT